MPKMFGTRCSLGAVAAHEQPPVSGQALRATKDCGAHLGTDPVVYLIDQKNRVVVILAVRLRRDVYGVQ